MDSNKRHRLEQRLAEADIHVSQSQRLVDGQRESIDRRRSLGLDVKAAMSLLAVLEDSLQLHMDDRERVRRGLVAVTAEATKRSPARSPGITADTRRRKD
jgi:hypothetical protein